jgi:hypothetical protein
MRASIAVLLALCGGCSMVPDPGSSGDRPNPQQGAPRSEEARPDRSAPAVSEAANRFYASLGAFHSPALQDVRTAATNSGFDPWGFTTELGFSHLFGAGGGCQWGIGLETGLVLTDLDGGQRTVSWWTSEEGGTGSMFRLTPTAVLRVPLRDERSPQSTALMLTAGCGYYALQVEANQQTVVLGIPAGYSYRELLDDSAFGGFVGIGVDVVHRTSGAGLLLEYEVHFASFDTNEQFVPPNGSIDGPMHILQVGVIWAF